MSTKARSAIGLGISALVVVFLVVDGAVNLFALASIQREYSLTGFPASLADVLGVGILVCALLYAVPQTSALGAILVTGLVGGAICAHLRLGEMASPPQCISAAVGVATWTGLYLRYAPLRALLPLTQKEDL